MCKFKPCMSGHLSTSQSCCYTVDNSILKNLSLNVSFYVMSNGIEATYLIDRFNYFKKNSSEHKQSNCDDHEV